MFAQVMVEWLKGCQKHFEKSTSALEESDSEFAPTPEMYTAAQQIAETAISLKWFLDGAFGSGWEMDFEKHLANVRKVKSISAAREMLAKAFDHAVEVVGAKSDEELNARFPDDDPIMPGKPKRAVIGAIVEHTAHHRGALTVYTRLRGKVPPMPYV